jgi:hypothetical protein
VGDDPYGMHLPAASSTVPPPGQAPPFGPALPPKPGPGSPIHDVSIDESDLDLATVVGRQSAPVDKRIVVRGEGALGPEGQFDPARVQLAFDASIDGDQRSRAAFALGLRGGLLFASSATGDATRIPITFAPPAAGRYDATLRIHISERREDGAWKAIVIRLRGTALPASETTPGTPAVTALPDAGVPSEDQEARAMLLRAADALA